MCQEPFGFPASSVAMAGATDRGLARPANEDAYVIMGPDKLPRWCAAVAGVFDGVGGRLHGAEASARAAQYVRELLGAPSLRRGPPGPPENLVQNLLRALHHMLKIDSLMEQTLHGMATTATIALLLASQPDTLWLGHVGDSPALRIRDGNLSWLTADDSVVGMMVKEGLLTPEQAAHHPQRHVITQALGFGVEVTPRVAAHRVSPGDQVLLCTDGLTNMVTPELILETAAAQAPDALCRKLIRAANVAGGADNITVVALEFHAGRPV